MTSSSSTTYNAGPMPGYDEPMPDAEVPDFHVPPQFDSNMEDTYQIESLSPFHPNWDSHGPMVVDGRYLPGSSSLVGTNASYDNHTTALRPEPDNQFGAPFLEDYRPEENHAAVGEAVVPKGKWENWQEFVLRRKLAKTQPKAIREEVRKKYKKVLKGYEFSKLLRKWKDMIFSRQRAEQVAMATRKLLPVATRASNGEGKQMEE